MCTVFRYGNGSILCVLSCHLVSFPWQRSWRLFYISTFFLVFLYCSMLWTCCGLSNLSPSDGHSDCFQSFAVSNKTAVNSLTHGSFHTCLCLRRNSYKWNCWVKGHVRFNCSSCKNNAYLLYKFQTTLKLIVQKMEEALPTTPIPHFWWSCSFFICLPCRGTFSLAPGLQLPEPSLPA